MFWFVFAHFVAFFVDLAIGRRRGDRDKDLRILVLRHQVRLLQRQRPRPPRLTRGDKLTLAVLTAARFCWVMQGKPRHNRAPAGQAQ